MLTHCHTLLTQLLVYEALGFTPPRFGHMSLILAPDKSKLSKRHGATSVGEFREQVWLSRRTAAVSYAAAVGQNCWVQQLPL